MTKIVIVHPGLYTPANEALTGSFAPDVVPIRYSEGMTKEDVLSAVDGPVSSIAFMYHYPGFDTVPFFYDKPSDISGEKIRIKKHHDTETVIDDKLSDISGEKIVRKRKSKYTYFSDTLINIITSLRDLNVGSGNSFIVDLLTCDLNKQSFKDEVLKVEEDLGVDIRYSVDKTGNPASGANWVLESDGINVKTLYFTDGVLAWNGVLLTDITGDIKNGTYSAFITWNPGTNTFTVVDNFSWSTFIGAGDADSYIVVGDGEIFDGNNKAIDITGYDSWNGLLTTSGTSLETGPVIKNLGILNGTTTASAGFIIRSDQQYFTIQGCYSTGSISGSRSGGICGDSARNCTITNCYSTGIIGQLAGGICGYIAGYLGTCTVDNCYSTGIIGDDGGGICGGSAGYEGICTVTNCYSTGSISGFGAGGICGDYAGSSDVNISSNCTIDSCHSTGSISGESAGGICGERAGYADGNCTVTNCYSSGNIGIYSGGICGTQAGSYNGNCTIDSCHSTGSIGESAGGICGERAGYADGNCTVTNCYSEGDISVGRGNGGGICGETAGENGTCTVDNCYSIGSIGPAAGGICGAWSGGNTGNCTVSNSYSVGNMAFGAGGIFGRFAGRGFLAPNGTCTAINCYSTGNIGDDGGGIIGIVANGIISVTNCHSIGSISFRAGGIMAGQSDGTFTISKCYSTGNMSDSAGGIVGYACGSSYTITNCYSTGSIGLRAGGIVADQAGGSCTVSNCYSTGSIAQEGGGIFGAFAVFCTASSCYSLGSIGTKAGGIFGSTAGFDGGTSIASNCYSTGNIDVSGGGICGSNAGYFNGICTITNCYSIGNIGTDAGGICGSNAGPNDGFGGTGTCIVNSSVCNGGTIAGSGSNNITINTSSLSLSDIDGDIYTGWSASIWTPGGTVIVGVSSFNLPILLAFQSDPWIFDSDDPSYYDIATDAALFNIPLTLYTYTVLENGTASITGYINGPPADNIKLLYISGSTSAGTLSNVPSAGAYQVTQIGDSVFVGATDLTGIAMPFVSSVGDSAFSGCTSLAYVYIGITSGVPSFGTDCFTSCPLTNGIYKNINNTQWTTMPAGTPGSLKLYTPLITTLQSTLLNATSISILPSVVSGGTISSSPPNPTLTIVYNYYVNGTQTQTDISSPVAQTVTLTDTYYLTAGNEFETNAAIGTGMSEGITKYLYGESVIIINIGM